MTFKQSDPSLASVSSITERSLDLNSDVSLPNSLSMISDQNSLMSAINKQSISAIQFDRDIYIEDIVMQKIIFYVSLFSEEVKHSLHELRSKDILGHLTLTDPDPQGFIDN